MFRHILVPTDGSQPARKAAELANRLALAEKSRLTLLTVAQYEHAMAAESFFFPFFSTPIVFPIREEKTKTEMLENYKKGLVQLRNEVFDPALEVSVEARYGRPSDAIVAYAKEQAVDLIVVGACGLGTVEEVLLGSVSDRVAHQAPCPVLIAR